MSSSFKISLSCIFPCSTWKSHFQNHATPNLQIFEITHNTSNSPKCKPTRSSNFLRRIHKMVIDELAVKEMGVAVDAPALTKSTHCVVLAVPGAKASNKCMNAKNETAGAVRRRRNSFDHDLPNRGDVISFVPENNSHTSKFQQMAILGFVLANIENTNNNSEARNFTVNVNCFFVQPCARKSGIASQMLDYLRCNIITEFVVEKNLCRFSEPTEDGESFIGKYMKELAKEGEVEQELIARFSFTYFS